MQIVKGVLWGFPTPDAYTLLKSHKDMLYFKKSFIGRKTT